MSEQIICKDCEMDYGLDSFWDTHQTMADGAVWCAKSSKKKIEEITKSIVNRYKAEVKSSFGNRKRHKQ